MTRTRILLVLSFLLLGLYPMASTHGEEPGAYHVYVPEVMVRGGVPLLYADRAAALAAIADKVDELPLEDEAGLQAMADFIGQLSQFRSSGVSADNTVWGIFTDGRWFLMLLNRPVAGASASQVGSAPGGRGGPVLERLAVDGKAMAVSASAATRLELPGGDTASRTTRSDLPLRPRRRPFADGCRRVGTSPGRRESHGR